MRVVVCPGSSTRNKQLLQQASDEYEDPVLLTWTHWNAEKNADKDYERVVEAVTDDSIVVAKSYGAALVLRALTKQDINPRHAYLMGVPLQATSTIDTDTLPQHKITVIQNEHDPHGSAQELKKHFSDVQTIPDNDTHTYQPPAIG